MLLYIRSLIAYKSAFENIDDNNTGDITGTYKMAAVLSNYDAGVSITTIRNHKSADGSSSQSYSSYNAHLYGSNYNKEHDLEEYISLNRCEENKYKNK